MKQIYTISKETSAFIDAITAFNNFVEVYYSAIEDRYGESADSIIHREEDPVLGKVRENIQEHFLSSVNNTLGEKGNSNRI